MANLPDRVKVELSTTSLLKITAFLLGVWVFYLIRDIIVLFFIVVVIVAALSPIVEQWQRKIGRGWAVTGLFLLILILLGAFSALIFPPIIAQFREFSDQLPELVRALLPTFSERAGELNLQGIIDFLQSAGGPLQRLSLGLFKGTLGVFSGIATAFTVLVLTFYLLLEERAIREFLTSFVPADRRESLTKVTTQIIGKVGDWLRGQVLLMIIIGLLAGVGLAIIQIPFALTLAVIAGLTEIIPYIGPVIGAIPAVAIALTQSPVQALLVIVLYIVIQQLEAQLIVPKVMQRAVGLSPVAIILALLIGGKLFGAMGAILAVPVAASVKIILDEWPNLIRLKS